MAKKIKIPLVKRKSGLVVPKPPPLVVPKKESDK
jgi:hypothetical protein